MIELVLGGASSGKSGYAEETAVNQHKATGRRLIYLATMIGGDPDTDRRIAKHVSNRQGLGFETVECPFDIAEATDSDAVILLECLSNLLANEMYERNVSRPCHKIYEDIMRLHADGDRDIIIVSNSVFSDGCTYDEFTMKYIDELGMLNRKIAEVSRRVTEVVCGIPVVIKDTEDENN